MTVFKRPGSNIYRMEFVYKGERYQESTGTTNKAEANAYEVKRRQEVKEDHERKRLGAKRATLHWLAQEWLKASETEHTDYRNNVSRVRKLFGDELQRQGNEWVLVEGARAGLPKDLLVQDLTQEMLTRLKTARMSEGVAPATVNREMSLVQSLIGYAPSLAVVTPNPPIVWSNKKNRIASLKMKESKGKLRWLTIDEETRLLAALAATAERRQGDASAVDAFELTLLLLDTGARYNEDAQVRWDMIDFTSGTINLYRSKVDNESLWVLPRRSLQMLTARRARLKGDGVLSSYVFPKLENGGRHYDSTEDAPRGHATRAIQRHIDMCGLNDDEERMGRVTPHTFRHTFASRLLQAGVSLSKVSKLLGHANETTTQIYAHLCPAATGAEAAAVLDRLHANKPPQGDNLSVVSPKVSPSVPTSSSVGATEQLALLQASNDSQIVVSQGESEEGSGRTYWIRTSDQRIKRTPDGG